MLRAAPGVTGSRVGRSRLESVDGLRGLAALIVLVCHSLLLLPVLIEPYREPPADASASDWSWWVTYTPLHLLWDGQVSVLVFFLLSGFVLTLAVRARSAPGWSRYYPQRLLRMYVPSVVAVALAVVILGLSPRAASGDVSNWVSRHPSSWNAQDILLDLILIVPGPGHTNPVLWTMRWEVVFSLLLPVFVLFAVVAKRLRAVTALKIAALLAVMYVGAASGPVERLSALDFRFHLPLFALGCLLAVNHRDLRGWAERWSASGRGVAWVAVVVGLSSYWLVHAAGPPPDGDVVVPATRVVQTAAAMLLIVLSTTDSGAWPALLRHPRLRWLGLRAFSLYLVHDPIVVLLAQIGGIAQASPALTALVAVVLSLIATEVFFRLVERPSHRVARSIKGGYQGRHRAPARAPRLDWPRRSGAPASPAPARAPARAPGLAA